MWQLGEWVLIMLVRCLFLSKLQKLFHCNMWRAGEGLELCDWLLFWKGKKIAFHFLSVGNKSPVKVRRTSVITLQPGTLEASASHSDWQSCHPLAHCLQTQASFEKPHLKLPLALSSLAKSDFTFKAFHQRYPEGHDKINSSCLQQG